MSESPDGDIGLQDSHNVHGSTTLKASATIHFFSGILFRNEIAVRPCAFCIANFYPYHFPETFWPCRMSHDFGRLWEAAV